MPDTRPPWELVSRSLELARARTGRVAPHLQAKVDQVDASIRDRFDRCGLCIADEWTAYTAIVSHDVLASQISASRELGYIGEESMFCLRALLLGNVAMFASTAGVLRS